MKEEADIKEGSVTSKKSIFKDGKLLIDDPELRKLIEESRLNYEERQKEKERKEKEEEEKKNDEKKKKKSKDKKKY